MDPINTLRQPFKAPGGSSWTAKGVNNNAPGRGEEVMHHEGGSMAAPAPFILYHTQNANPSSGSSSSSAAPWSEAAARAVKRAKNNAGGFVYRDGESTGYEDDGSEAPLVDSYTSKHKPTSMAQFTALRDHTNGHREASTSYPAFAGLKPRVGDGPAGQSPMACTRYFQVSHVGYK